MRVFLSTLLLWMATSTLAQTPEETQADPVGSGPQINQDRVVDYGYCYLAMGRHDANANQRIDEAEYLNFARDFGQNTECLGLLTELPLELRVVWNQLSCECAVRGGDPSCCLGENAHIPITGIEKQVGDPDYLIEEQFFLRQACLRTDQAIIAFCGPPPPPIIPGPPPAFPIGPPIVRSGLSPAQQNGTIAASIIAFLIWLCCCRRRRWCFFAGAKDLDSSDDSSSSDEESDSGGIRHVITEEGGEFEDVPLGDDEGGAMDDADADRLKSVAVEEEEDGNFGGARYGRTVEEPEYEDEESRRKAGYEQYDLPDDPDAGIALRPVTPPPAIPDEEDPYELEHYLPDGGIIEHERTGEWSYEADGGYVPPEDPEAGPAVTINRTWNREVQEEPEPVDNRRHRQLEALSGGEIFNILDADSTSSPGNAQPDDMFDWVIQSTLNTLDQKADDLQASEHNRNP